MRYTVNLKRITAAAVLAALLTGCGGGTGSPAATTTDTASAVQTTGDAAAEAQTVTADGAGEVSMLEFEYGAALVGAFAPLESGREFGSLLALESLNERRVPAPEQCRDFLCG